MKRIYRIGIFFALLCIGVIVRFWLSSLPYNVDIVNYLIDVEIFHSGNNIYQLQPAYNYSPIWYWVLGLVDSVRLLLFPSLTFPFVIRVFLSLVDIMTLCVLMIVAKKMKISYFMPLILFFLNPVSMIISAKHGQFDNVALLFLLLAWMALQKKRYRFVWMFGTVALLVKHIVLFPLMALYWGVWGIKRGSVALIGSLTIFFLSFLPYISAWNEIVRHVFLYGGVPGEYGVSSLLTSLYQLIVHPTAISMNSSVVGAPVSVRGIYIILTLITIILNTIFPFLISSRVSVWHAMLYTILFFLATTTGIGAQYFVLPLIFAWADRNVPVIIYTIVATLFLVGSQQELGIHQFSIFSWNIVWGTIVGWLVYEMKPVHKFLNAYEKHA